MEQLDRVGLAAQQPVNQQVATRLGGNRNGGVRGGYGTSMVRDQLYSTQGGGNELSRIGIPRNGGVDRMPMEGGGDGELSRQGLNQGGQAGTGGMPRRQVVNDQGWFGGQAGAINARLSQLLNPDYATVRRTDSEIAPLWQSIDRQSMSAARQNTAAAAERAAAEGTLGGGGFSSQVQQINEMARAGAGDAQAQLMWDASNRRNENIQQGLGLAANLAEGQQGRNMQRELADLQNQQIWNDLQLRGELGRGDLDVRREGNRINLELGRGGLENDRSRIRNQNNQFYDDLGFRRGSFESQMNQNIVNRLLGF